MNEAVPSNPMNAASPSKGGCGYFLLAMILPPVAIWWAYRMPKGHPSRQLRLVLTSVWLVIVVISIASPRPEKVKLATPAPETTVVTQPMEIPKSHIDGNMPVAEASSSEVHPEQEQEPDTVRQDAELAEATPAPKKTNEVQWEEFNKIYNVTSSTTELQKKAAWSQFEGKHVIWTGKVTAIDKGILTGLTLQVKMNDETLTSDVIVTLKDDQEEKAMRLSAGSKVKFSGVLDSWGTFLAYASLKNGEILSGSATK